MALGHRLFNKYHKLPNIDSIYTVKPYTIEIKLLMFLCDKVVPVNWVQVLNRVLSSLLLIICIHRAL